MDRIHNILNDIADAAQKTYQGKKRSELKDSDFLFPETRSFPIVSPSDIPDAISNFGRMKGKMSYDAFLKKLYNMAKRKGSDFVAAFPEATKDKLGIKDSKACYVTDNNEEEEEDEEENDPIEMELEKLEKEIELKVLKQKLEEIKKSKGQDFTKVEDMEEENVMTEMMEYKNDFFQMSLGSIKSIAQHAQAIVDAVDSGKIKDGLTESWLQGKIAVTEDYMITIHNFLMFGETETDTEGAESAKKRPGLWDNIRKKKEKMGKKYRPARPGDKDRPDPDQWKKLTK